MFNHNMQQFILPITHSNEYNIEDYIFSECNKELQDILDPQNPWGYNPYPNFIIVTGPEKSGKTHFLNILRKMRPEVNLYDDIDNYNNEELLHIFNILNEKSIYACFFCKDYSHFTLADLSSRLNSIRNIIISQPDDFLIRSILSKHLLDFGIRVSDEVIKYLIARVPRSFASLYKVTERINDASIQQKRNITVHFLSTINFDQI